MPRKSAATIRMYLSALVLVMFAAAGVALGPQVVRGSTGAVCEFDDGTDEWACAPGPHMWKQWCEGEDCYSSTELCCIEL